MLAAAKEGILSLPMVWSEDSVLLLAANLCAETGIAPTLHRGQKPHQGVAGKNLALDQGSAFANSKTALGLRGAEPENRIRSRCTGKERDSESNLDNFGARYFGSSLGRFMSPDPSGIDLADLTDPQQLNLYSYVRNNPLVFTDPNGLDCVYLNDAGNGIESIDQNSNAGECQQNGGAWAPGTITNVTFDSNSNDVLLGYANQGNNGNVDYSQITATPGQFNPGDWNDALFNAVGQGTQMAGYFLSTPQRWYDAEQAWMAAHPNIEGALMIGAALAGGGEGVEGEGAGFGETGEGSAEVPGRPFRGKNASEQAYQHLEQFHGIDPATASERLHNIKQAAGLGPADDVIIGRTGDVYNAKTGERIGSLTQSH